MGTEANPISKALTLKDVEALQIEGEPRRVYCTKKAYNESRILDLFELITAGYQVNIVDPNYKVAKEV